MVDIWVTLGTMVVDVTLLNLIKNTTKNGNNYKPLKTVITYGNPPTQDSDERTITLDQGGIYLEAPTVLLQNEISSFFAGKYPSFQLPISLYAAGYFCKLADIEPGVNEKSFLDAMSFQNEAYGKLGVNAEVSFGFVMTLGLALVDTVVRTMIKNDNATDLFQHLYFQPSPDHVTALKGIVKPLLQAGNVNDILRGPLWDVGCLQVHEFYGKFPHAVG